MMKMMILAPRRRGMTHAEFRRYVTQVHGPLVCSVAEVAADIRHYHYNFPVQGAIDSAFGHPIADHLDIVTQGWFDSREAQLRNMTEPRYLSIIRPDEGRFADETGAVMHYTHETVIKDGPPTLHKVFYFRRRHPALSREAFQQAWATQFPTALGAGLHSATAISRYVQNVAMSEADHPQGSSTKFFDVIDEFHLTEPGALGVLTWHPPVRTAVTRVEQALLELGRTRAFVGETVHNIP